MSARSLARRNRARGIVAQAVANIAQRQRKAREHARPGIVHLLTGGR